MSEIKIGGKVKLMRKSEFSSQYNDAGQGVILGLAHNRNNEPVFVKYSDREWKNLDIWEWISINSLGMKILPI